MMSIEDPCCDAESGEMPGGGSRRFCLHTADDPLHVGLGFQRLMIEHPHAQGTAKMDGELPLPRDYRDRVP